MSRLLRRTTLALAAVLMATGGCHRAHYVVVQDAAPLYSDAAGDAVITTLPRYAHADLDEVPDAAGARVKLTYEGKAGFADPTSVRVFEFLHPVLDDGADRARMIRKEVRELQLADLGEGWDQGAVDAIRAERVITGMTRTQVEVAWGWPVTVEAGAMGERWIYRESIVRPVRRFADSSWNATWGSQHWGGPRDDHLQQYPAWVTVRVPVVIERIVEFDEEGRVKKVKVRRYLDEAGSS